MNKHLHIPFEVTRQDDVASEILKEIGLNIISSLT